MIPGIGCAAMASPGTGGGGTEKTVFITSTGSFNVPSDFGSLVAIEAIGGGAAGITAPGSGKAGGGGAYSKLDSLTLSALQTVYVQIGVAGVAGVSGGANVNGGDTWLNTSSNVAPSSTSTGLLAKGGTVSSGGGVGGQASSGIGSTKYSGGDGYAYNSGGGAAGPDGAGTVGVSGQGGAGNNGQPGGGAGAYQLAGIYNGGAGTYWTQTSNGATAGPGGGGIQHYPSASGNGGNYGGAGGGAIGNVTAGNGAAGIIVFRYLTA